MVDEGKWRDKICEPLGTVLAIVVCIVLPSLKEWPIHGKYPELVYIATAIGSTACCFRVVLVQKLYPLKSHHQTDIAYRTLCVMAQSLFQTIGTAFLYTFIVLIFGCIAKEFVSGHWIIVLVIIVPITVISHLISDLILLLGIVLPNVDICNRHREKHLWITYGVLNQVGNQVRISADSTSTVIKRDSKALLLTVSYASREG
ncbi:uncharacterized protein LOC118465362 isoform X2 [Anopheles albimanus]|uniref:uncharacterized protein LOC118465362 isoform X2 n=1 Tax=Anopheles albimanus TaxID=7167 RepID=UPI001640A9C4|nr:uncharacterized protein LOC118465362 isoform X2 [Anopheles albimanus]